MAVHYVLTGRVQGVGFRNFMVKRANQFGARGWVRNLTSGQLDLIIIGSYDVVERVSRYALSGPIGAKVEHTAKTDIDIENIRELPDNFKRLSTSDVSFLDEGLS